VPRSRNKACWILAAFALLVVALGLPRVLVVCDAGSGGHHIEFVHAPGACCRSEAHWHAAPNGAGDQLAGDQSAGDHESAAPAADCEHRSPEDADLHAYLHQVTALARAQFETALERVALHEGLLKSA
jgi:hypothetical protein